MRKFYRLKILTLCLTLLMAAVSAYAVPAKPTPIKVKQADGTELTIKKFGDEFFNWTTTVDGYNVAQKNGVYYYVNINANGSRAISNQKVGQVKSAQEISFLSSFRNADMASMAQSLAPAARQQRSPEKLGNFPSKGKIKSIILLVQYKDVKFGLTDAKASFTKSLNEAGYSENGGTGSARDYYADNSRGAFDGEFVVEGPFTLSEDMAYYGGNDANGNDLRPREMTEEAVRLADASVDFSQFDYDNDGVIDNVFLYYAGYNEAEGGPDDSIWPHRWSSRSSVVVDGKSLDGYACSSEYRGASGEIQAGIGTFSHEFGHVFGLHDLYDTDYKVGGESPGLGSYDVMTSGSYSNNGCTPPLFNALQRVDIGWVSPIIVDKSGDFTVKTAKNGDVYRINSDIEGEYFLIENRLKNDIIWEKFIPGSGLSIMHIDRSASNMSRWNNNRVNADASHQCAKYIYANNKVPATAADWASIFYTKNKSWTATSAPKNAGWSGKANPVAITAIGTQGTDYVFKAVRYEETSVVGVVVNDAAAPVEGVVITMIKSSSDKASGLTLMKASDPNVYTATTNAKGEYIIKADPGSYVVTATKEGYSSYAKAIEVEQGQYKVDIELKTIEQANFEKKTYQTGVYGNALNFGGSPYGAYTYYSADEMKKFIGYDMRQARIYVLAPSTVTLKVLSAKDINKVVYTKQMVSGDEGYVKFDLAEGELSIEAGKNYYVGFEVSSRYVNYLAIDDATTRRANVSDLVYFGGKWSTVSGLVGQQVAGNIMIDIFIDKPTTYVDPVSITLPATANVLMKGIMQLSATVLPAGANQFVEWSSNNIDVATVDKTGKVIGVNEGTATITAVSPVNNKVVSKCVVTVGEAKLASATGVVTGFDDAKLAGATVTFIDRAVKSPATNTVVKSKNIDPSTIVRKSANTESLNSIQLVTKQAITDKDGLYSMKDLYAGVGYDIYVEAAEDKYDLTAFGLSTGLAEGPNTINLSVLENPVFGKDLHQYHNGVYANAVGTAGESEFAIRIKKEDLVDFVGDKFLAVNFTVGELRDDFAVIAIYYGDALSPVKAYFAEIGQGLNRIMIEGLEAGVPADMDIVIGVTLNGRMGMDNAAKAEGGGNLIWSKDAWVPVSALGDFNGNWMIGVYTEDAAPTPVEAFKIVVPNGDLIVGSEIQLGATYSPWNATYIIPAWTSSDEKLATIDENGLVKGISEGTVTITATAKDESGVIATVELPVVLKQAITGKVTDVEGGIGAGAKLRFLPITKSEVGSGTFKSISYQDVATKADIIETVADEKGAYDVAVPMGDYRVEVSSEGCVEVKEMIIITKGINIKDFKLLTRFFTTSAEHSYSDKTQKNAVGAGGGGFGAFAKWSSKDLKDPKDTKITRITAVFATACEVEMMILVDGNMNKPVYKKAMSISGPTQVVLSLTPEEAVTIEAGKDVYVGYMLKDGYGGLFPASTGSNATVDGKGNMLYMGGWQTLKSAGLEGNWMVSMYTQTAEQIKGVEMVAGQIDANLSWNAAGFTQFRVSYNEKADGATPVVAELDQPKFVFTNLKPGTAYEYEVVGIPTEDGAKEIQLVSSEFKTLAKVVSTPMVYLTKNTYSVGEMLILKAINITGDEKVTWYFNDVEQDYLEINLTKKGSYVIKSKIEKTGQKTVYTVKKIVVN